MNSKNHIRAVRYRQLALAEPDRAKADVRARRALHPRLIAQRDPANPAEATKLIMICLGHLDRRCPARPADRGLLLDSLLHGGHLILIESRRRLRVS
jgi:hypothetical protein